ncbi:MAG: toll/interleukin-1 receptor domain-containing protein [candidate division Zixibacteria bacterium]|nr:toll/interleukin-1 receptor domain-containing protein [candidate division Zixibacteria bacterium]
MDDRHLGKILTLLDGKLLEYNLWRRIDSNNPLNIKNYFYDISYKNSTYSLKIPWSLVESQKSDTKKIILRALRFALNHIRSQPEQNDIYYSVNSSETNTSNINGVEKEILNFIYSVNSQKAKKYINSDDIVINTNANIDFIYDSLDILSERQLLIESTVSIDNKYANGTIGLKNYRINFRNEDKTNKIISTSIINDVKVFMSYSNTDKSLVGKIKQHLEEANLSVFVAHDDIEISEEWEDRILKELRDCHVFIALLTPNFRPSEWTDQEVGSAIAGNKLIIPLIDDKIHGFLKRKQGLNIKDKTPKLIANEITEFISNKPEFADILNTK